MTRKQILFSFQGRIGRKTYWTAMIFVVLIPAVLIVALVRAGALDSDIVNAAQNRDHCRRIEPNADCSGFYLFRQALEEAREKKNPQSFEQLPSIVCSDLARQSIIQGSCKDMLIMLNLTEGVIPFKKVSKTSNIVTYIIITTFSSFVMWMNLAITTKRLHDINLTGWFQAIPIALSLPKLIVVWAIGNTLFLLALTAALAISIGLCGFIKGKAEPNKYGESPLK